MIASYHINYKIIYRFYSVKKVVLIMNCDYLLIWLFQFPKSIQSFKVYQHMNSMAIKIIYNSALSCLFVYYIVNLMSLYLLMYHIKILQKIRQGEKYIKWRKLIRSAETKALILILLFEVIYVLANIVLLILSNCTSFTDQDVDRTIHIWYWLFDSAILLFQILFINKFATILQNNLNFHFKNQWKRLSFMMLSNIFYFVIWLVGNIFLSFFNLNEYILLWYSKPWDRESIRIIILIFYIITTLNMYLYVYLNMKGINFKSWILDLFSGYQILHHYEKLLFFITFKII